MSTRCVINFCYGDKVVAKIYRHSDGYPSTSRAQYGVDTDLDKFFEAVEEQAPEDPRFGDPSYLAAKFVVWQAGQNSRTSGSLNFLGVGIILEEPGDIEYRWFVDCKSDRSKPKVHYKKVY